MNRNKKRLAFGAALLSLVLALSACDSTPDDGSTTLPSETTTTTAAG